MTDFSLQSLFVMDALVAAGVVVGALLFVYTIGRHSVVPMLAALGFAAAFAALAPYVGHVPGIATLPEYQQQIAVFALVTAAAYLGFRRHKYFEPSAVPSGVEIVLCGAVIGGFILAVIGAFLPADVLATISPQLRMIFGNDWPRALWLAAPMIVFGATRGK